jgi:cyclopropane-fatty-acyl-phospholipid synthase
MLFTTSIKDSLVALQFRDRIIEVGSGKYVCTIAPPSLFRLFRLLLRPDYRVPDYFTKGYWLCERGKVYEFLELLITQKGSLFHSWFRVFSRYPVRDHIVYQLFPLKVKKRIATHYNTAPDFMKLILGERLEYTCAFFDENHVSLEAAQDNKINTIIERLGISRGHTVLDMGCGWGQIAEAIVSKVGARVTGVNLSEKQIEFATYNKSSNMLEFVLSDYESFSSQCEFDRIYSIGMIEHIGRGRLSGYFQKIRELLAPNGLALAHCIVRRQRGSTNSWIDKEIFPGAYIPQLSDIIEHIDRSGLRIEQIFTHDETHYFRTLQAWIDNCYKNDIALRQVLCDLVRPDEAELIMKVWEFYLNASQLVFSASSGYCYNVQIVLRH